jgi:1-carboxybiuret hydrolase
VGSFDHLGPLARTTRDLALAYDATQGADPDAPAQTPRTIERVTAGLATGIPGPRIAMLGGYFKAGASPEARTAVARIATALGASSEIELPDAFDPAVRDRLIAGTMIPAAAVIHAQKFRRWYQQAVLRLLQDVDVLLPPATPTTAPLIGQTMLDLDGRQVPLRPNMDIFTQALRLTGFFSNGLSDAPSFTNARGLTMLSDMTCISKSVSAGVLPPRSLGEMLSQP